MDDCAPRPNRRFASRTRCRNELRREDGQWKIHTLRSRQTSFIMRSVDEDGRETVTALGQAPAAGFIENA
ncbi:MAG: hypothetical protein RR574_12570 [Comamonas sp.]